MKFGLSIESMNFGGELGGVNFWVTWKLIKKGGPQEGVGSEHEVSPLA